MIILPGSQALGTTQIAKVAALLSFLFFLHEYAAGVSAFTPPAAAPSVMTPQSLSFPRDARSSMFLLGASSSINTDSAGEETTNSKPSRAERKARERAKKQNNRTSPAKSTSGNRKGRRPGGDGNNNNNSRL